MLLLSELWREWRYAAFDDEEGGGMLATVQWVARNLGWGDGMLNCGGRWVIDFGDSDAVGTPVAVAGVADDGFA